MRMGKFGAIVAMIVSAMGGAAAASAESSAVLANTYWYVPPAYLAALSFDPDSGTGAPVSDQTVWQITNSGDGYFWGRSVAVFSGDNAGMAGKQPNCSKLAGSVTPSGEVLISFVSKASTITGIGKLKKKDGQTVFQMQMSSGQKTIILHWADMAQCKAGQPCWDKLPGSDLGVEAFMAQCGS